MAPQLPSPERRWETGHDGDIGIGDFRSDLLASFDGAAAAGCWQVDTQADFSDTTGRIFHQS
jgi:hypothetical protein